MMTYIGTAIGEKQFVGISDHHQLKRDLHVKRKFEKNLKYISTDMRPGGNKAMKILDNIPLRFSNKLRALKRTLDTSDRFDVVIDGLNVGYYDNSFKLEQVSAFFVSYFIQHNLFYSFVIVSFLFFCSQVFVIMMSLFFT